ncbi:hypothetical protein LPJ81_003677, partial [Coemansia sp. IMI 209127]
AVQLRKHICDHRDQRDHDQVHAPDPLRQQKGGSGARDSCPLSAGSREQPEAAM